MLKIGLFEFTYLASIFEFRCLNIQTIKFIALPTTFLGADELSIGHGSSFLPSRNTIHIEITVWLINVCEEWSLFRLVLLMFPCLLDIFYVHFTVLFLGGCALLFVWFAYIPPCVECLNKTSMAITLIIWSVFEVLHTNIWINLILKLDLLLTRRSLCLYGVLGTYTVQIGGWWKLFVNNVSHWSWTYAFLVLDIMFLNIFRLRRLWDSHSFLCPQIFDFLDYLQFMSERYSHLLYMLVLQF